MDTRQQRERELADRKATALFAATSIVVAITVGSMMIGDWGAGSLDNRVEWVFWAGAVFGAVGVILLAFAAFPAGAHTDDLDVVDRNVRGVNRLIRAGILFFLSAPILCVIAVMTDYWI